MNKLMPHLVFMESKYISLLIRFKKNNEASRLYKGVLLNLSGAESAALQRPMVEVKPPPSSTGWIIVALWLARKWVPAVESIKNYKLHKAAKQHAKNTSPRHCQREIQTELS